jgi:uncharacterized protein involved in exopolysaccharide biosynthesis
MKTGRTYLSTFRLRWKTVLVAALLGELAGVLATSLINPTYSSSSTVLVSSRPIDGDAVSAYRPVFYRRRRSSRTQASSRVIRSLKT